MKILIFTASAGNGHNSTANKIKNKVLQKYQDAEIKIVDMYKSYASELKSWIMSDGYALLCNHSVGVYNHFFKKSEKSTFEVRDKVRANDDVFPLLYGALNEIYTYQPDIIVCTYIFTAVAISNLRRCYTIPAKVICMTLDYGISPYWECVSRIDKMFITGEYMHQPFIEKGFTEEQLVVSGIPVDDAYSVEMEKGEARKKLNIDENLFTMLVTRSSFFPLNCKKLVSEFAKIKQPIQILICNGLDKKGKKLLDKLLAKVELQHKVINYGFVDKELLPIMFSASDVILCKGGGLTLTEAITKCLPPIIIDKLPQQEIYNKKYLIDNNAGLSVDKKHTISMQINSLLDSPETLQSLVENIKKLRKTNVLDCFLEYFESCPKADYSNLAPLKDSKGQVLKNVKNARKLAIKAQKAKSTM